MTEREQGVAINKMAVLGLGLIGGSLALAAKERGLVNKVSAWGRSTDTLEKGLFLGIVDDASIELEEVIAGADVIVVATPVIIAEKLLVDLFKKYKTKAIVTDVGSTKGNLLNAVEKGLGYVPDNLMLAHPIAGSESSGIKAARNDLYDNHRVILTPTKHTQPASLNVIKRLWEGVGAEVISMDVKQHDRVLAATSHLPHILAYALVDTLCSMEKEQEVFRFAAGGFRDFTRIAKSSPHMWHDIFMSNKSSLLEGIDEFSNHLLNIRSAIEGEDSERLMEILEYVAETRKRLHTDVLPKK